MVDYHILSIYRYMRLLFCICFVYRQEQFIVDSVIHPHDKVHTCYTEQSLLMNALIFASLHEYKHQNFDHLNYGILAL